MTISAGDVPQVEPLSGAEIEKVMAEINAAPQEAIDRLGKLVN